MPKRFNDIPSPNSTTQVSDNVINEFEKNGLGNDSNTDTLKTSNEDLSKEVLKRISIDVPQSIRKKYKAVCHNDDTTMVADLKSHIQKRITESLEN